MDIQQEKQPRINSLTSIRLFCTFLVAVHHLNLARYTSDPFISFLDKYFLHTGRGIVSFFFFISGFVICYSSTKWPGWKMYLIKRMSRVYPNHWLISFTLAGFTFLIPLIDGQNLFDLFSSAILNLGLLQAFVPDRAVNFAFNGVTWTLSVELFFYLSYIWVRKQTNKTIFFLLSSLLVVKIMLETTWIIFNIQHLAHWIFFVFPLFRWPEFLLGVLLCRIYLKDAGAFLRFRLNPILMLFLTILSIGLCRYYFSPNAIYLFSTLPAFFGFLLLLSCLGSANNQSNFLNRKLFLFLGDSSFAIYLMHQPIFNGARRLLPKLGFNVDVGLMLLLLLFSLMVAIAYFVWIEQKIYNCSVKFLSKLFHQPTAKPVLTKNSIGPINEAKV